MSEPINIPGYRIERKLGQGGMAAVYLAIQQSFEREVALKIMSPLLNSDPSFTTRFVREARIVAHIHHASIVPVFDVGEHQPYHYLSMEYLPGGDLKQRILQGQCTPRTVIEVCTALCAALDVAHRKGFVHRDIKPENVLFREDGTPVLTDFGIARALDSGTSLTLAGMLVGTPSYMSPEQVKGQELDGRSDLYSLGIVCYEMFTGTVPFRADSTMSVAIKHLIEPLPSLPPHLAAYQPFLNRLTAKERNDRFATGHEALQALLAVGPNAATSDVTLMRPLPSDVVQALTTPATPWRDTMRSAATAAKTATVQLTAQLRQQWLTAWAAVRAWARRVPGMLPRPKLRLPDRQSMLWLGGAMALVLVTVVVLTMGPGRRTLSPVHDATVADSAGPAPAQPAQSVAPMTESVASAPVTEAPAPEVTEAPAPAKPDPAVRAAQAEARARRQAERERQAEERRQREAEAEAAARQSQEQEIQRLLAEAKTAYARGSLVSPAGDNAADRYQQVLKLEAEQPDAIAGLQRIAYVLVEEAQHAQSVGDAESLRTLITQIASVQPDHPQLVPLQTALLQLAATPAELSRREATNLDRAAKYVAKSYEYLTRKPFDLRAADLATDQYDRAAQLAPMAPGLPSLRERLIAAYAEAVQTEIDAHDPRRALRMISLARKRNWMTPDLEQLEASIRQDAAGSAGSR